MKVLVVFEIKGIGTTHEDVEISQLPEFIKTNKDNEILSVQEYRPFLEVEFPEDRVDEVFAYRRLSVFFAMLAIIFLTIIFCLL